MLKLVVGIAVGTAMRVVGMVWDRYKHLSPCSSLADTHCAYQWRMARLSWPRRLVDILRQDTPNCH